MTDFDVWAQSQIAAIVEYFGLYDHIVDLNKMVN